MGKWSYATSLSLRVRRNPQTKDISRIFYGLSPRMRGNQPETSEAYWKAFSDEAEAQSELRDAETDLRIYEEDHGDFAAEYRAMDNHIQELELARA